MSAQSNADGPRPEAPAAPRAAREILGDRLSAAERYVELLADTGVSHGLVGPREVPRLWERHVLNCAVVQEIIPAHQRVIDVGSGAGLPGLVLALARGDLDVHLVEPMLRRTTWLTDAVAALGLTNVTVHRARADELARGLSAPVVTARAVARLDRLADWCLPLVEPHGRLLALKGASAATELEEDLPKLGHWDLAAAEVVLLGEGLLPEPTRVVTLTRGAASTGPAARRGRRTPARRTGGGRTRRG